MMLPVGFFWVFSFVLPQEKKRIYRRKKTKGGIIIDTGLVDMYLIYKGVNAQSLAALARAGFVLQPFHPASRHLTVCVYVQGSM
jgi:hypothetical protein